MQDFITGLFQRININISDIKLEKDDKKIRTFFSHLPLYYETVSVTFRYFYSGTLIKIKHIQLSFNNLIELKIFINFQNKIQKQICFEFL